MTTAIVGLLGVVVGSVVSSFVNFVLQRKSDERRWAREDQVRLRDERLKLYRSYNLQIEKAHREYSMDLEETWRLLSEIELFGSDEVSTWAIPLYFDALDYQTECRNPDGNPDEAEMKLSKSRFKFIKAVQEELGIWETEWDSAPRSVKRPDEENS